MITSRLVVGAHGNMSHLLLSQSPLWVDLSLSRERWVNDKEFGPPCTSVIFMLCSLLSAVPANSGISQDIEADTNALARTNVIAHNGAIITEPTMAIWRPFGSNIQYWKIAHLDHSNRE
jgi:hypothetical protein